MVQILILNSDSTKRIIKVEIPITLIINKEDLDEFEKELKQVINKYNKRY